MTLGEKIKHYRTLKGWTQKSLAEKLGFDPNAVSNWERNKCEPNLSTIKDLAHILEMDASVFLDDGNIYPASFFETKSLLELSQLSSAELTDYIVETQDLDIQCGVAGSMPYHSFQFLSKRERRDHVLNAIEQYPYEDLEKDYLFDLSKEGLEEKMKIIEVDYVSFWDGDTEIMTKAKYHTEKNEVFDVESVDVPSVEILEREYIILPDGRELDVVSEDDADEYEEELKNKEKVLFKW